MYDEFQSVSLAADGVLPRPFSSHFPDGQEGDARRVRSEFEIARRVFPRGFSGRGGFHFRVCTDFVGECRFFVGPELTNAYTRQ